MLLGDHKSHTTDGRNMRRVEETDHSLGIVVSLLRPLSGLTSPVSIPTGLAQWYYRCKSVVPKITTHRISVFSRCPELDGSADVVNDVRCTAALYVLGTEHP